MAPSRFPTTIVDVLDSVFEERDFDLNVLDDKEFLGLIEAVSEFADQYSPPTREPQSSRFYGGGVPWNQPGGEASKARITLGPRALVHAKHFQRLQTICLTSDSVVCHDPVSDFLFRGAQTRVFPNFYENVTQGENNIIGLFGGSHDVLSSKPFVIENLNPVIQFYDKARFLIQTGILVPVPAIALLHKYRHTATTQLRYGIRDPDLLSLAGQPIDIATTDEFVSLFMEPVGMQISAGPAEQNPRLRLHYGMLHLIKCTVVAVATKADFVPSDSFGWRATLQNYDRILKAATQRSKSNYTQQATSHLLKIPLVKGFPIEEVISLRRDEELFDELRKLLRESVAPRISSNIDTGDFLYDFERTSAELVADFSQRLEENEAKRGLFSPSTSTAIQFIGTAATLFLADVPLKYVAAAAQTYGLFGKLTEVLGFGADPRQRLVKILRRHIQ